MTNRWLDGKIMLFLDILTMRGSHVASLVKFRSVVYLISYLLLGEGGGGGPLKNSLKDLDPSCNTDLDLWECFGRETPHFTVELHKTVIYLR